MALLIAALVAGFYVCSVFLVEVGLPPSISVVAAIPISFAVGYALSRVLRGAGAL